MRCRQHLVTCSNALQSLLAPVWQLRQHQSLFVMHNAREAMNWNDTLFLSHLQYANNIMLNRPSWPNATVASLAVKSVSMPHIEAEEFPCRSARGARRRSRFGLFHADGGVGACGAFGAAFGAAFGVSLFGLPLGVFVGSGCVSGGVSGVDISISGCVDSFVSSFSSSSVVNSGGIDSGSRVNSGMIGSSEISIFNYI